MTGPQTTKNILVVHSGGLGDLVLLSELIASLKQSPGKTLTLMCRAEFTDIVGGYPIPPDEIIGFPFQPYAWTEANGHLQAHLEAILSQFAGREFSVLMDAALRPNWLPEFLAAALEPHSAI